MPGFAHGLRELAASIVNSTAGVAGPQGTTGLAETLTDGLLEDALEAFEPVVAAVEGGVTARGQQRWFAALVMRALGVQVLLAQADAEKAGARLLKRSAKVRASVTKAMNSGEPDKIDVLRRTPYHSPGAPPLSWQADEAPAPTPAPALAPAPAPELPHPPAVERLSRIKFPRHWVRSLGTDGCARVEARFDDEDDDTLAIFTDENGELNASGLRLVITSLVHDERSARDERDRAEAERGCAIAERDRAITERDRATLERDLAIIARDSAIDSALQEADEEADRAKE